MFDVKNNIAIVRKEAITSASLAASPLVRHPH